MSEDGETIALLRAIAEEEGKSLDEVVAEFLKLRSERKRGTGSTAIERAPERRTERRPDPSPRRRRPSDEESDEEAMQRWLEEERNAVDGVLGPGGMSAGGIFGEGVVATEGYDPLAEQRYERRMDGVVQRRLVRVLERLEEGQRAAELPGGDRRGLPGRRR